MVAQDTTSPTVDSDHSTPATRSGPIDPFAVHTTGRALEVTGSCGSNGTGGTLRITADAAYPEICHEPSVEHGGNEPARFAVSGSTDAEVARARSLQGTSAYSGGRAYAAAWVLELSSRGSVQPAKAGSAEAPLEQVPENVLCARCLSTCGATPPSRRAVSGGQWAQQIL
jgi:hypothetical protein